MSDEWREGRIRARVYRRGILPGGAAVDSYIGGFDCLSANGGLRLGLVGSGEVTAPLKEVFPDGGLGIKAGDIVTVVQETAWGRTADTAKTLTPGNLRIACFIVRNIRDDNNQNVTISGDDMLAELQDWPAVSPIGQATEYPVDIAAPNHGKRTFLVKTQLAAGVKEVTLYNATADRVFEDDDIQIALANGDTLLTSIREVISSSNSARTVTVGLANALPSIGKAPGVGGVYAYLYTSRLRVTANMTATFKTGNRIKARTSDRTADGRYVMFETRIDGLEEQDIDGTTQYWIRLESPPVAPIPDKDPLNPAVANKAISTVYDKATTTDIAELLSGATFGAWSVAIRDADCTIGTTYEPSGESVWDALSGMLDFSAYTVKHIKNWTDPTQPDKRQVRVMNPAGKSLTTGTLLTITGDTRRRDYLPVMGEGALLDPLKLDIEGAPVTHVIPFGGGSGQSRFDLSAADLTILDQYNAALGGDYVYTVGRRAEYWVVYRERRPGTMAAVERMTWRVASFPHIRPINENSVTNTRAAANQLLRAALDYLEESRRDNMTIEAKIHTLADPQPGDLVPRVYSDLGGRLVDERNMLISEVRHEVSEGIRVTTLLLTKNRTAPLSGEEQVAQQIRQVRRHISQTSAPTAGGATFGGDRLVFPGGAVIGGASGAVSIRSQTSNVEIAAAGLHYINAQGVQVSSDITAKGIVEARRGLGLLDENDSRWLHTSLIIRDIPRVVAGRTVRHGGAQDAPELPPFDDSWVGSLY